MSKLLFFLLSFFKVYFCQLLITSYSKKIMREKLIEMYKYIFLEYSFESLYNSEFNDIEYNNTKLSDIEVNNFNVTDKDYNPYFLLKKNIIVFSPNKIIISFKCRKNDSQNYSFFYFKPFAIIIKGNNETQTEFDTVIEIEMNYNSDNFYSRDPEIKDILELKFMEYNLEVLEKAFNEAMKEGINDLYLKYEPIKFKMDKIFFYEIEQFIELNQFAGPCDSKEDKNTVQCYYIGTNKEIISDVNKNIVENIKGFFDEEDKFKLFINLGIMNSKFKDKIVYSGKNFNFTHKESLALLTSNFKKYFPGKDETNFYVSMKYYLINSKVDTFNVILNVNITTAEDIIKFDVEIEGKLKIEYSISNLNFYMVEPQITNIDDDSRNYTELINDFNNQILKDKVFHFADENGIELYDFFKVIQNVYVTKEGFIIEGEPLFKNIKDLLD